MSLFAWAVFGSVYLEERGNGGLGHALLASSGTEEDKSWACSVLGFQTWASGKPTESIDSK